VKVRTKKEQNQKETQMRTIKKLRRFNAAEWTALIIVVGLVVGFIAIPVAALAAVI
jgi:hypothetical protein